MPSKAKREKSSTCRSFKHKVQIKWGFNEEDANEEKNIKSTYLMQGNTCNTKNCYMTKELKQNTN